MDRCFPVCRFLLLPALISLLPLTAFADPPLWAPPELAPLIVQGITGNQEIKSAHTQLAALQEKIPFEGALEDPKIGFGLLNLPVNSYRFDREPMTQKQVFISQKLPWYGKLDLKSRQAVIRAERQTVMIRGKELELARKVTAAYYELVYLDNALRTNRRLMKLVAQASQVAEAQYVTGRGPQQDMFQAQVELGKLQDEKLMLSNNRRNQEDILNALLSRESFMAVETTAAPEIGELKLDEDVLRQQLLEKNPWLKIKSLEIEMAELDLDLSQKDYWPDMDVRLAYGQRDEDATGRDLQDFLSASVTMNIPLWKRNRQDRKANASRLDAQAARQSYDALRLSLNHRIDALKTDLQNNHDSYRLYQDQLIKQTRDWASSALAAYEVGRVDFDTMINARMRVLRFHLQAEKYRYGMLQKRAELEELIGGPLPEKG